MTMDDTEAERVRTAYARRSELGLDARYDHWQPHNLFIYQARERAVLSLLNRAGMLPLTGRRVLDVGCGDGSVLLDMQRYGAFPSDLCGIDLLPDRIARARGRLPEVRIDAGDARSMPYEDGAFDLTLGFTLLSSVRDPSARRAVADEMRRVTRAGGLVLLYDFWINPTNRHVRPLKRFEVGELFLGGVDFESTTLAPPIARALFKLPGGQLACTLLDVLPFLRTHFVAAIHIAR
jgi:ubiquinone/menaquinone biosynthesis C-methylase UbiE